MSLYTFIMNYLRGVYISQVIALNERAAMRTWLKELDADSIDGFTEADKQWLIEDGFSNEDPILLNGCQPSLTNSFVCFRLRRSARRKKEYPLRPGASSTHPHKTFAVRLG